MPDIFGYNPLDYQHHQVLQRADMLDSHLRGLEAEYGQPHDFDVLTPRGIARAELNTQASGFMTANSTAIMSKIHEILYVVDRLEEFIPIERNIPEGAESYQYRVVDKTGKGQFITSVGSDVPPATVSQRPITIPLYYAGISAEWTLREVRAAMMQGFALRDQSLDAAVRGGYNQIEEVAFIGSDIIDAKGLTNLATGTGEVNRTAATATFDVATAEAIRTVINNAISRIIQNSKEIFGRNVQGTLNVALPVAQYDIVTTEPFGDNSDRSLWEYISMNNPWTFRTGDQVMLRSLQELEGAGNGNTDRMVVYPASNLVMEMGMNISPRLIRIEERGYKFFAPIEYMFSGLHVFRPTVIEYVDGI